MATRPRVRLLFVVCAFDCISFAAEQLDAAVKAHLDPSDAQTRKPVLSADDLLRKRRQQLEAKAEAKAGSQTEAGTQQTSPKSQSQQSRAQLDDESGWNERLGDGEYEVEQSRGKQSGGQTAEALAAKRRKQLQAKAQAGAGSASKAKRRSTER